jgi:hypothetical protein
MIKSKEKFLSNIWHYFLLKKIDNFLGVNSNLTVQKMVEYFCIISVFATAMSNIFQIKETRALYHSCGLRYLAANVLRFLSRELHSMRPLYCSSKIKIGHFFLPS